MNIPVFIIISFFMIMAWLLYRLSRLLRIADEQVQDLEKLAFKYKSLQKTLIKRRERLNMLLSSISEVVLHIDKEGRVLGGNQQAERLFDFSKVPELPQSMLLFYRDSEWIRSYQRAVQQLPAQKNLPEMKIKGRVLLPRLVALSKNDVLLLCMDVTEHTHLQQKQKNLLENLMHDLKTPLTSLLGYARSIETFADDVSLRAEAVGVIIQESKHINELMNHMLTLNQIEYSSEKGMGECDVVQVMQRVWHALEYDMQQKGVSFIVLSDVERLNVEMIEVDCHRILMNIMSNALHFSPVGKKVQCMIYEAENFARIEIKDFGPGIADKHLSRVTERFYRVDNVRGREEQEGHGLGLAIVKEILDRDHGELHLSNHDEGGLLVTIQIPLSHLQNS
ncbi:MAG: ATP-binding protein [Ghiorsea sp.]|nr:ATP-binding protein [Ghiorsea sp.]